MPANKRDWECRSIVSFWSGGFYLFHRGGVDLTVSRGWVLEFAGNEIAHWPTKWVDVAQAKVWAEDKIASI